MTDSINIPDFLRIPQDERAAAWRGRRLTRIKPTVKVTRDEDASTRAFRREVERAAKAKREARFKMLRERAKAGR